jgi:hypothetical protein
MYNLFVPRSTLKTQALPASYRGPWRDTTDPMLMDDTPDSQAHPMNATSSTHSYPPQPRLTTDAGRISTTSPPGESPTTGESPQAGLSPSAQSPNSVPVGHSKRSNEAADDDQEEDHPVSLKVRLVAQEDWQQQETISMILKRLEGLQTTVSNSTQLRNTV